MHHLRTLAVKVGIVAALAGCSHSDTSVIAEIPPSTTPFSGVTPTRLTYETGVDQQPSHSIDGNVVWYVTDPADAPASDQCLASIRATGGTRTLFCDLSSGSATVANVTERPTPGPDGQMLYTRYTNAIGTSGTAFGELVLATVDSPTSVRVLSTLPMVVGDTGFVRIGRIRWVNANRFFFVGYDVAQEIGHGLFEGTLSGTTATFRRLAGTGGIGTGSGGAIDFDLHPGGDSVYFVRSDTLIDDRPGQEPFYAGDARLYAVATTGGAPITLYADRISGVLSLRQLRAPTRTAGGLLFLRAFIPVTRSMSDGTISEVFATLRSGAPINGFSDLAPDLSRCVVTGVSAGDLWRLSLAGVPTTGC